MVTRKLAFGVVVAILAMAASTHAWEPLSRTNNLTFTGAVALPGVVLGSGTYVFEAGPGNSNPALVRVLTANRQQILYTGFTVVVERPRGMSRDRTVVFGEAPAGAALPIAAWYPIGSSLGHRFIYR